METLQLKSNTLIIEPESFLRAMEDAGVTDPSLIYFVDDSALNIDAAQVSSFFLVRTVNQLPCQLTNISHLEIGLDYGSCR